MVNIASSLFLGRLTFMLKKTSFLLPAELICLPTVSEVVLMAHCFCFTSSQAQKQNFISPFFLFFCFFFFIAV